MFDVDWRLEYIKLGVPVGNVNLYVLIISVILVIHLSVFFTV